MKLITLLLTGLLLSTNALAFDYTFKGTVSELEDLVIKKNGITLNNFTLGESQSYGARQLSNLDVSFSARNKTDKDKHFVFMAAGLDSKGVFLWALDAGPSFSTLSKKATGSITADPYVTKGTLQETKKVIIRVLGDF
jgi:hypothetical protein